MDEGSKHNINSRPQKANTKLNINELMTVNQYINTNNNITIRKLRIFHELKINFTGMSCLIGGKLFHTSVANWINI